MEGDRTFFLVAVGAAALYFFWLRPRQLQAQQMAEAYAVQAQGQAAPPASGSIPVSPWTHSGLGGYATSRGEAIVNAAIVDAQRRAAEAPPSAWHGTPVQPPPPANAQLDRTAVNSSPAGALAGRRNTTLPPTFVAQTSTYGNDTNPLSRITR